MTGALDLLGKVGGLPSRANFFGIVPAAGVFTGNYVGQNNLCLVPVPIESPTRVTNLGSPVFTGGEAGSVVRHGIYSTPTAAAPSVLNLIADYGVTSSAAVVDVIYGATRTDILLQPGTYWFGVVSQLCPVTPPTLYYSIPAGNVLWTPQQQYPNAAIYVQGGVSGALPSTVTMTTLSSGDFSIRQMIKTGTP